MLDGIDFVVVGAGLYGSIVAHELSLRGRRGLVVERRSHVGGNCWTHVEHGIVVHDYGAHIFNTDSSRVWDYVNSFVEFVPFKNTPIAVNGNTVYSLPINMMTFSQLWGVIRPEEAKDRIARQIRETDAPVGSIEHAVVTSVGREIYETLIRDYTEKQWGRSCRDLPSSILRRIPVRYTYDNNYYRSRYQGIPVGGYSLLFDRLLSGIRVLTGIDDAIVRDTVKRAVERKILVVWTGAIDSYFDYALGRLDYRSLRFEHEWMDIPDYQGNAVVNYCDKTPYTRSIEHKHFMLGSGQCCEAVDSTLVSREYPCCFSQGTDPYYPINDDRNMRIYGQYVDLARGSGIFFGGRLGSYSYNSMTDTVDSALTFSESEGY